MNARVEWFVPVKEFVRESGAKMEKIVRKW